MKKILLGLSSLMAANVIAANPSTVFDDVDFRAATEKTNPVGYGVGEPIRLTFTLENADKSVFSRRSTTACRNRSVRSSGCRG